MFTKTKIMKTNWVVEYKYTRCTYSQCMPRAHFMTFEPTGDTCALLFVGMASTFGTVGHVQQ